MQGGAVINLNLWGLQPDGIQGSRIMRCAFPIIMVLACHACCKTRKISGQGSSVLPPFLWSDYHCSIFRVFVLGRGCQELRVSGVLALVLHEYSFLPDVDLLIIFATTLISC